LVLGTGEEVPQGQSIRARLVILELGAGEVDRGWLSRCQQAGRDGRLAAAMGGFVRWVAGQNEGLQRRLRQRVVQIRGQSCGDWGHARTPAAMAELQAGWEIFLQFAVEAGAMRADEQEALAQRHANALAEVAQRQAQYQESSDPALSFVARLRGALANGQAHVVDRQGRVPAEPAVWGWQRKATGQGWMSRGTRIGWVAGSDLFLEPKSSYRVAQQMPEAAGLAVGEQVLRQRLRARGLLESVDASRQMLVVRRTLEGSPRQVLHLRASAVLDPSGGSKPAK
jgi:hypothetical protein